MDHFAFQLKLQLSSLVLSAVIAENRLTRVEQDDAHPSNNTYNAEIMNVVDLALLPAWADVRARPSLVQLETNSWLNKVWDRMFQSDSLCRLTV